MVITIDGFRMGGGRGRQRVVGVNIIMMLIRSRMFVLERIYFDYIQFSEKTNIIN